MRSTIHILCGLVALGASACDPAVEPRYLPGTSASGGDGGGHDSGEHHDDDGSGYDSGHDDGGHDPTDEVCNYRTQTQGGWGSKCAGLNPGCLRDELFPQVYKSGMVVGCNHRSMTLYNKDIEDDLPAGGPARAFSGDEDDTKNVLFGQATALALNVKFDEYAAFNPLMPPVRLADLEIARKDSPCHGMTVGEVLLHANDALGGCESALTAAAANECATMINESFVNGGKRCSDVYRYPERRARSR